MRKKLLLYSLLLLTTGSVATAAMAPITVGTEESKADLDVNFQNTQNNFDELAAKNTEQDASIATKADASTVEAKQDVLPLMTDGDIVAGTSTIPAVPTAAQLALAAETHGIPTVDNTAYDASSWDGNADAATKDAIRDKIESLVSGGTVSDVPAPPAETVCTEDTYYVSNSGSDSADGLTYDTAWQTASKVGSSSFSPGDCVLFNRGDTWSEKLVIPSSGTTDKPITFGAYGMGDLPVFDGTGVTVTDSQGLIRANVKDYITIEYLRVQDAGVGDGVANVGIEIYQGTGAIIRYCEIDNIESAGIQFNTSADSKAFYNDVSSTCCNSWSEQISLSNVDGFEIAYNESHDTCPDANSGGSGIDAKGGSRNGTIHHNEVYNIITDQANGIYVDAYSRHTYDVAVYSNYVHNVAGGAGIAIGAEDGGALNDVLIHHNIVTGAEDGALVLHDVEPTGLDVEDIYVYNNTFYGNGNADDSWKGGVRVQDSMLVMGGITLKNNIFASNHNYQVGYDHSKVQATDLILDYNVVYGDTNTWATSIVSTNAITTDPLFTDAANEDFTLQDDSPARGACSNAVWQGTPDIADYNGTAITDGNGDIVTPGGTVNCGAFGDVVTTVSALTPTVQAADPTSASATGWYLATGSGDCFYKTDDGLFTIDGTYVAD